MSTSVVDTVFLAHLESLYPPATGAVVDNPWYISAAVAYSAANHPEAVPKVFEYVLEKIDSPAERLKLARKMRDALFKSGIVTGYPKVRSVTHKPCVRHDSIGRDRRSTVS
jgi:hypothetical protein